MRNDIEIDVSKLVKDYNSSSKYTKYFGGYEFSNTNDDKFMMTLVEDEDARFINLFGLSVDIKSGDVALGYFPDPNRYIKVNNFYNMLRKEMFNKVSSREFSDDELRYIFEYLKLNPKYFCDSEIKNVIDYHTESNTGIEFDSIILNLLSSKAKSNMSKDMEYFYKVSRDGDFVVNIIRRCISLMYDLQSVAKDYFRNFISEKNSKELLAFSDKGLSISDILDSSQPNLESLMLKYISYGIPIDFLIALSSYGFGIKQRMSCFPGKGSWKYRDLTSTDSGEILRVGELLSSLAYIDNGSAVPAMVKVYNIMDLLRALDQEQNMLFALEVLSIYKNSTLYTSMMKKYNLEDILLEGKLTEQDFLLNVSRYGERYLSLIDKGGMYTRGVLMSQYQFSTFSRNMVMNSGRLFEKAYSMVKKKFKEV